VVTNQDEPPFTHWPFMCVRNDGALNEYWQLICVTGSAIYSYRVINVRWNIAERKVGEAAVKGFIDSAFIVYFTAGCIYRSLSRGFFGLQDIQKFICNYTD
jgi:hypothetical protein